MNAPDTILYCGLFTTLLVAAPKRNRLRDRSNSQARANDFKTVGRILGFDQQARSDGCCHGNAIAKGEDSAETRDAYPPKQLNRVDRFSARDVPGRAVPRSPGTLQQRPDPRQGGEAVQDSD